jgi:hypothetical protein
MTPNNLVGTWKLISYEVKLENEQVIHPFGKKVRGYLIYTEDGYMSVNIMKAERPLFVSDDFFSATLEEKVAAFETFFAYSGKYEIFQNKIMHYPETSFVPNWIGIGHERPFKIIGNQLLLRSNPIEKENELVTYHATWERV